MLLDEIGRRFRPLQPSSALGFPAVIQRVHAGDAIVDLEIEGLATGLPRVDQLRQRGALLPIGQPAI